MFDFEGLIVYKKSREFRQLLKPYFSKIRDRFLRDQLQRASLSIILNLTEGAGKYSSKEKINYFRISRGSAFECVPLLQELKDDGVMPTDKYLEMYGRLEELAKMISGLIGAQHKAGK